MASHYASHSASLGNLSIPSNPASSLAGSAALPQRNAPAGTMPAGTVLTVGQHSVTIERWLSEGGFAHVYVVRLKEKIKLPDGSVGDVACLKRVVAPDKEALAIVRTEVETMKRLKGHRNVVTYIDSHACELQKGGYEVFLLMEFCSGGGLIDFMNTRLQDRLTESEILKIFGDVSQGVACMHYLQPPLLHRDIKVENVLIASRCYKLCDFGSSAQPRPAGTSPNECRAIDEDIQKHTTLQYRSPEMVDVYRRLPIDEKSDIWALGVFLYKLCYYTTPFEEKGTLAILNATFSFPALPSYSAKIKNLIAWTLREHPKDRPNIYELVKSVCILRGTEIPIRDIYTGPAATQPITQSLPTVSKLTPAPSVVNYQPVKPSQPVAPTLPVEPMRRGRPVKATPSPQPDLSEPDPFVKLGSSAPVAPFEFSTVPSDDDDIASRFPTIEELSGGAFTSATSNRSKSQPPPVNPSKEEVEALADNAFALPVQPYRKKNVEALADDAFKSNGRPTPAAQIRAALEREKDQTEWVEPLMRRPGSSSDSDEQRTVKPSEVVARGGIYTHPHPAHSYSTPPTNPSPLVVSSHPSDARTLELRRKAEQSRRIINESRKILEEQWPDTKEPVPERPKMVSVGVMTSPPSSPLRMPKEPQTSPSYMVLSSPMINSSEPHSSSKHFGLQETEVRPTPRSKTPLHIPAKVTKEYIVNSESLRPKSRGGYESISLSLGKGLPKQGNYMHDDLEFLRSYDQGLPPLEKSHTGLSTASQPASFPSTSSETHHVDLAMDLDYLRMKDEETKSGYPRQASDGHHSKGQSNGGRRSSPSGTSVPKHIRQTSLGTLSKGIMSGKFGEAFRKFEGFSHHENKVSESRLRAEKTLAKLSPEDDAVTDEPDEDWKVETHDIPVQMKQHLSETRKSITEKDPRLVGLQGDKKPSSVAAPRRAAVTIQQRMNEYLAAQKQEKPPPLTADGYGPYINNARAIRNQVEQEDANERKAPGILPKPQILRQPSLKGSSVD